MKEENRIIRSLWIGPFTTMERLCIRSFQANGHEFHLYLYEPIDGIPPGTIIKDAGDIVSREESKKFNCAAHISNIFSYRILLKCGGWFTDMDNVCLKPLDFPDKYIFYRDQGEVTMSQALIKCPPNSPIMRHCCGVVDRMSQDQLNKLAYQDIGPELMRMAIPEFNLMGFLKPGKTFDPIRWDRPAQLVNPEMVWDLENSYSLHLFHGAWNRGHEAWAVEGSQNLNTEQEYAVDCLYEQLKRKYLPPPKVSIVITTLNRPKQLRNTLNSIFQQEYKNLEVIIVDDGNDSETKTICQRHNIRRIELNPTSSIRVRNPALPNNIGIREARGEIVVLQNAECQHLDPHTIRKLVDAVTDTNAVFAKVTGIQQDDTFEWLYCGKENPRPYFFCGAIKRVWFEKLRGFDEDYVEPGFDDTDFGDRLKKEGVTFEYTDIEVCHQWHPRMMPFDPRMQMLYEEKKAAMERGELGTIRNLNREWGKFTQRKPEPIPPKIPRNTIIPSAISPALPVGPVSARPALRFKSKI